MLGSIESRIHQCNRLGVRIGNGATPELRSADLQGCLSSLPLGIVQRGYGKA